MSQYCHWCDSVTNCEEDCKQCIQEELDMATNSKFEEKNIIIQKEEENMRNEELTLKELLENVTVELEESKKRICELKEEVGDPIGTAEYVTDDDNLIYDIENDLERLYEQTDVTDNYAEHQKAINNLSVTDLIETVDYIKLLSIFIPKNNEVLDNLNDIVEPFEKVIKRLKTNITCPYCGKELFKSDLPDYDYVCENCNENFYTTETK